MKPPGNRSSNYYRPNPKGGSVFRVVIIFVLCGLMFYILYRSGSKPEDNTGLSDNSEPPQISVEKKNGNPEMNISLDGKYYQIDALIGSSVIPTSEDEGADIEELNLYKNSALKMSFENPPDSFRILLYQNDTIVYSSQSTEISKETLPNDGEFIAQCEAVWSKGAFKGKETYRFGIVADFPPEISVSASEIKPGELLVICVDNLNSDEKIEVETDLDFKPKIYEYVGKKVVLLPVSYYNKTDKLYQIKIRIGDETSNYVLKLNNKDFTTQYLTIDKKIQAETRNEKSAKELTDKLYPLKPVSDEKPYWVGEFQMPVEGGRVNEADFGKKRYVNNAPTSYRHNGLDIGHDKGVRISASNSGRVLIAEKLIQTGNTIVIEHGFGLKTWYYHMDELSVKTGDFVKKGDAIGKLGSTGFSTSPHLHFSASVNGVYINPITLINKGVPLIKRE